MSAEDYTWTLLLLAGVFMTLAVYATYRTIGIISAYIIYRRELYLWTKGKRSRDEIDYREFNLIGPLVTAVFCWFVALSLYASVR